MLRYALRRVLWVFPSVIGVSIFAFFVLSLVPSPLERDQQARTEQQLQEEKRRHFLDLPLFVNLTPADSRSRTMEAVEAVLSGGEQEARRGRAELARLGGVALALVLPKFDEYAPDERPRLALAFAPLAIRMGLPEAEDLGPERAVRFWERFWLTHGIEFREATARSAVGRYARYGTAARERQLRALDTFALPSLMAALAVPADREGAARARRIVGMMAHVTGREDRIALSSSVAEAAAACERWQRWWMVFRTDFVPLSGASRIGAVVLETRYGKWVWQAVMHRMGRDELGRPVLDQLLSRMRITLSMLALAVALAYLLAIPLGALSAFFRGRVLDRAVAVASLCPYVVSPAVLAALALHLGWPQQAPMVWATALLTLVLLADPTRQQRAELLPVLTEDYIRAAAARGAGPLRLVVVHGLRNAMLPLVTRVALELPWALTAVFVLERAFAIPGLGEATVAAVQRQDPGWLMALAVTASIWAVVALVFTDVAYAVLDPRLRQAVLRQRGPR